MTTVSWRLQPSVAWGTLICHSDLCFGGYETEATAHAATDTVRVQGRIEASPCGVGEVTAAE